MNEQQRGRNSENHKTITEIVTSSITPLILHVFFYCPLGLRLCFGFITFYLILPYSLVLIVFRLFYDF